MAVSSKSPKVCRKIFFLKPLLRVKYFPSLVRSLGFVSSQQRMYLPSRKAIFTNFFGFAAYLEIVDARRYIGG